MQANQHSQGPAGIRRNDDRQHEDEWAAPLLSFLAVTHAGARCLNTLWGRQLASAAVATMHKDRLHQQLGRRVLKMYPELAAPLSICDPPWTPSFQDVEYHIGVVLAGYAVQSALLEQKLALIVLSEAIFRIASEDDVCLFVNGQCAQPSRLDAADYDLQARCRGNLYAHFRAGLPLPGDEISWWRPPLGYDATLLFEYAMEGMLQLDIQIPERDEASKHEAQA